MFIFFLYLLCPIMLFINQLHATVIITHGMGTSGIQFYHQSTYVSQLKAAAKQQGHTVKTINWISPKNPCRDYAGLLIQERIQGAVTIAHEIIKEINAGKKIILIGHGIGGQIMQCASKLMNPENTEIADSYIYELIAAIKNMIDSHRTKGLSPKKIIATIATIWNISNVIVDAIAQADIINQNVIQFIKQHINLEYNNEIKSAWNKAYTEIQARMIHHNITHKNAIETLYTIGTPQTNSPFLCADMDVIQHHINFYSAADKSLIPYTSFLAAPHARNVNLKVYVEPNKSYAPNHESFCGNTLMSPWILTIPHILQQKLQGNFEHFVWNHDASITFYKNETPCYTP